MRGSRRSSTRRGSPTPRAVSAPTSARSCGRELLRSALQYLARKTGASDLVIERFLTDVAYYLDVLPIRTVVVDIVAGEIRRAAASHDKVVLVTHSLGTVVAYDVFDDLNGTVDVPLFVTAGCPLGLPAVRRNLLPAWKPAGKRPGPDAEGRAGAVAQRVRRPGLRRSGPSPGDLYSGSLREERTLNAGDPHAIQDYLADPDVARPIGRALAGKRPW